MLYTTLEHLAKHGVIEKPEVVLGDAGYWQTRQIRLIAERGMEILVRPDGTMRAGIRPGWEHGQSGVRLPRRTICLRSTPTGSPVPPDIRDGRHRNAVPWTCPAEVQILALFRYSHSLSPNRSAD